MAVGGVATAATTAALNKGQHRATTATAPRRNKMRDVERSGGATVVISWLEEDETWVGRRRFHGQEDVGGESYDRSVRRRRHPTHD